jgi:hypothetical protein
MPVDTVPGTMLSGARRSGDGIDPQRCGPAACEEKMCATLAGPLRSDSLRQSRGCAEAPTGSTCSLPLSLPIFEDDLGLGPNARSKGGRVRRRNHPPCAPCLIASCGRMPGCLSREGVSERPRSVCHSDEHSLRPVSARRLSSCARRCARPGSLQHPEPDPRAHGHTDNRLKEIKGEEGPAFLVFPADNRCRQGAGENANHSKHGAQPA